MNRILLLGCLLMAFGLSRCVTRSIDINLPAGGNRPVLLGMMNNSDSVDVLVGRTAPRAGVAPANIYVRNATVEVLANGGVITGPGRYIGGGIYRLKRNTPLTPGIVYQTRASASNWGTLTSLPDTLPISVPVANFVTKNNSCTLTFTDPPGRQYYAINIELYKDNERVFKVPTFVTTFTDDLFSGQSHSLTFSPSNAATRYTSMDETRITTADYANVRLLSVSRQTYQFLQSIDEYELSTGSFDIEPTAPPSGISGGLGYVGVGNSTGVYSIRFN